MLRLKGFANRFSHALSIHWTLDSLRGERMSINDVNANGSYAGSIWTDGKGAVHPRINEIPRGCGYKRIYLREFIEGRNEIYRKRNHSKEFGINVFNIFLLIEFEVSCIFFCVYVVPFKLAKYFVEINGHWSLKKGDEFADFYRA